MSTTQDTDDWWSEDDPTHPATPAAEPKAPEPEDGWVELDPQPAPVPAPRAEATDGAEPKMSAPCWSCGAQVAPRDRRCDACDSPRTHVLLLCSDPCLELRHGPGRPLNLGRSRSWAAPAGVTAFAGRGDYVSRRHVSVTVEPDGSAWAEEPPQGTRNHTYVNGARLTPGVRTPLRDGDQLRLGESISLAVRLFGPDGPTDASPETR